METIQVELGQRRYPILIEAGLIGRAFEPLVQHAGAARFVVVADQGASAIADRLAGDLQEKRALLGSPVFVKPGEESKSFPTLEWLCSKLLDAGVERGDAVVAVGGGVIGDLAGFASAIVKRGTKLVQVPTTLLAQVDSSVGGKTGINTRHGKNLIGAFHQPSLVLIDPSTLHTLPEREFRAGYAEVVKYGALGDAGLFGWLEDHRREIFRLENSALTHAIAKSCAMKADIVARDEFEKGDRALLNLGHTFGHAIEAWAGYSGTVLHGEAVAFGMALAARFSHRQGLCGAEVPQRLERHLRDCGFAIDFDHLQAQTGSRPDASKLMHFMEQDKKVVGGKMNLILMHRIGEAFIARDVDRAAILAFLQSQLG